MNDDDVLRAFAERPLPPSLVDVGRAVQAGRRRQRTRLALVAAAVVGVVAAGAVAALPIVGRDRAAASGRTQFMIAATTAVGGPAGANDLRTTAAIVQKRLRAAGFPDASVSVVDGHLVAAVRGRPTADDIAPELAPGALTIRKVIDMVPPSISSSSVPPWRAAAAPAGPAKPPTRSQVLAELGPAATAAGAITDQTEAAQDPALEPFRHLSPAEVAVLPPTMQLRVPQIGCPTLDARPIDVVAAESGPVVACDPTGAKYLLDGDMLTNADLASATAETIGGSTWAVDLTFTARGASYWAALSAQAYDNTGGACVVTAPRQSGGAGVCQVAFVIDNSVLSAPAIQAAVISTVEMTGGDETETRQLAADLAGGRVTLALVVEKVTYG